MSYNKLNSGKKFYVNLLRMNQFLGLADSLNPILKIR